LADTLSGKGLRLESLEKLNHVTGTSKMADYRNCTVWIFLVQVVDYWSDLQLDLGTTCTNVLIKLKKFFLLPWGLISSVVIYFHFSWITRTQKLIPVERNTFVKYN